MFFSTPFDPVTARDLEPFVPAFKIASADITFFPLLEAVAETGKPVILSTGLATLEEARTARDFIHDIWRSRGITQDIALLHCVSCYPVPPEEANLAALPKLRSLCRVTGYSDHTLGVDAAVLAVALGARIIEKHFTLDKNLSSFRDHQMSADPEEFSLLVRKVRQAETLLGQGSREVSACEEGSVSALRRSIALNKDLPAGTEITAADLRWVRPGTGIAPGRESAVMGRRLRRDVGAGVPLVEADLEDRQA